MTDLVQDFFTRDLSEAEHEALSGLLAGSPDVALRYEGLLEQNYLSLGLPQPTLPPGLRSLPKAGGLAGSAWLAMGLAGLAALGLALWKYQPRSASQPAVAVKGAVEPSVPILKKNVKRPLPVAPVAAGPAQEGQELSVLLDAPQRSLVTVRILDAQGREVRALYTGFVEAGRWNFTWDGLLADGAPAGAGNYRIDVQSGATHLSKDIQIKLAPAP
ncbi:MAG TPA: FlgD immunoglobulin-like domain containing protein [bacterium]|nr:FlgD immunoglobulin-like domain containing protein [bacterium]